MKHLNRSIFSCSFLLPLSKLCVFLVLLFIPLLVPLESWGQSAAWDSFSKLRFGPAAATEEANGTSYPVVINKNRPNPLGNLVELPIAGILATTQTASSKGIGLLTNGYIGYLGQGTFGDFGSRWISLGDRLNFASALQGTKATGLRTQYFGQSSLFGMIDRNVGSAVYDGLVEWNDNQLNIDPNDLSVGQSLVDFSNLRFVFSTPRIRKEVMTITPKGRVGIDASNPSGKLAVYQGNDKDTDIGIFSYYDNSKYERTNAATYSILGINNGICNTGKENFLNVGVGGFSEAGASEAINIGVSGVATQAKRNIGVYGAVYTRANGYDLTGSQAEYPDQVSNWAGYFNGDVGVIGKLYQSSDENLKEKIAPLENSTDLLKKLKPKSYLFKKAEKPSALTLSTDVKSYGFLAQEMEKVMPELVKQARQFGFYDSTIKATREGTDLKMINYIELIPILVGAAQEQEKEIARLRNLIEVKTQVEQVVSSASQKREKLSSFVVSPNPFKSVLQVSYQLGGNLGNTKIVISDLAGKVVTLKQITASSSTLDFDMGLSPAGIYIVSLWQDGQELMTSKVFKD